MNFTTGIIFKEYDPSRNEEAVTGFLIVIQIIVSFITVICVYMLFYFAYKNFIPPNLSSDFFLN